MDSPKIDLSRAKPHPKDRAVAPEDPMNLHAVELDGDPEIMLRMIVEEYARMGCNTETLMALCREPFYQGLHGLLRLYGEEELRRRVSEILARTGVARMKIVERNAAPEQLVQITPAIDTKKGISDV